MAAVAGGHAEVVKFLITRKANVNLAEPCHGYTALHFYIGEGNLTMIELLISKGAKHDVRDKIGSTSPFGSCYCYQLSKGGSGLSTGSWG